jgi:uncharacterized membrane protein
LAGSVGPSSIANGVNADGSMIVGATTVDALGSYAGTVPYQAFRWISAAGRVSLGKLNGGRSSYACAVSADGSVVVGQATDSAIGNVLHAIRWT